MKVLLWKIGVVGVVLVGLVGCKSSALNDAAQGEKQKEQGQVDQRSNAIDKMAGSAGGN